MSFLWISGIGISEMISMALTDRVFLPRLRAKYPKGAENMPCSGQDGLIKEKRTKFFNGLIVLSAVISAWLQILLQKELYGPDYFKCFVTMNVLGIAAVSDKEIYIIPNFCSAVLVGARIGLYVYEQITMGQEALYLLMNGMLGAALCMLILLFCRLATHGGIGLGDIKLFSAIGFMFYAETILFLLTLSLLLSAVTGLILVALKKTKMSGSLPMGPFIFYGFILTVLIGVI